MSVRKRFLSIALWVVMALVLYVLVLAVSYQNRYVWDLSQAKRFTLAPQTKKLVRSLNQPVKAWVFLTESDYRGKRRIENLLERYKLLNKKKFTYEIVDPVRRNDLAKAFEVRQPGVAVLEIVRDRNNIQAGGRVGRRERARPVDESSLTSALLKLTQGREHRVYFLSGHGESDLGDRENRGLSLWREELSKEGYQVQKLSLIDTEQVPADCEVLVIAGPRKLPVKKEQLALISYLKNGGKAFFLLNPDSPSCFVDMVERYGIKLPRKVVVDARSKQPFLVAGRGNPKHPITRGIEEYVYFLFARPVVITENAKGKQAEVTKSGSFIADRKALITSGSMVSAFPLEEVLNKGEVEFKVSEAHPITLMAVVEGKLNSKGAGKGGGITRVAVAGNIDFVTNKLFRFGSNLDVAMNTLHWLTERDKGMAVRPRENQVRPLVLSASQMRWLAYVHVFFLPAFVFFFGVLTASRRGKTPQ